MSCALAYLRSVPVSPIWTSTRSARTEGTRDCDSRSRPEYRCSHRNQIVSTMKMSRTGVNSTGKEKVSLRLRGRYASYNLNPCSSGPDRFASLQRMNGGIPLSRFPTYSTVAVSQIEVPYISNSYQLSWEPSGTRKSIPYTSSPPNPARHRAQYSILRWANYLFLVCIELRFERLPCTQVSFCDEPQCSIPPHPNVPGSNISFFRSL